jgi:hypothetical protein
MKFVVGLVFGLTISAAWASHTLTGWSVLRPDGALLCEDPIMDRDAKVITCDFPYGPDG